MVSDIREGFKDSIPIIIGYFSVSFTFGIMAASFGISPTVAGLISLTNVTSAGQFAGISLIHTGTTVVEMILTQIVINLRYALMSLTLTQKLDKNVTIPQRMAMSFVITDEIFAMAAIRKKPVNAPYMFGLGVGSVAGWVAGTVSGAIANNLLPESVQSALGVALYGMFIAIVMPNVRKEISCLVVVVISLILSCGFFYIPLLSRISSGFVIIICTVLASILGALFFPNAGQDKVLTEE